MTSVTSPIETLRQSDLAQLTSVLETQRARAIDVVASAARLQFDSGYLHLRDIEPAISDAGVTEVNGLYLPGTVADEGLAAKLDIPISYLRRCKTKKIGLYDDNLNGWLREDDGTRKFLLRLFRSDNSDIGVLRAFLSDSYFTLDNFDSLLAALQGVTEAGVDPDDAIIDADLTERRMVVRVAVPGIAVHAPKLLEGYRNPFTGEDVSRGWTPQRIAEVSAAEGQAIEGGGKVIFAGLVFTNSEVGNGRFRCYPELRVQVCNNGLSFVAEGYGKTHLGAKLDEGTVQWSEQTLRQNLALITNQVTDSVKSYLNPEYVAKKVALLEQAAGVELPSPEPVIAQVAKKLGFSEAVKDQIFARFIKGGQVTAGGVMQAVSAAAQVVGDGDLAYDLSINAVKAMHLAVEENKQLVNAGK